MTTSSGAAAPPDSNPYRPRSAPAMKGYTQRFYGPEDEALTQVCEAKGLVRSEYVRRVVRDALLADAAELGLDLKL